MARDIKCANILLDTDGTIKLTDFGTSTHINTSSDSKTYPMNRSLKGSPYWMSPEVVSRQGHTYKADIWSLGGCVIEMLTGKPPYADEHQDLKDVLMAIKRGQRPKFPSHVTRRAIKFLDDVYTVDQDLRPSANDLL